MINEHERVVLNKHITTLESTEFYGYLTVIFSQQCLNFLPLPQGQ